MATKKEMITISQVQRLCIFVADTLGVKRATPEQISYLFDQFKHYQFKLIDKVSQKIVEEDTMVFPKPANWLKWKRIFIEEATAKKKTHEVLNWKTDEEMATPEEVKMVMSKLMEKFQPGEKELKTQHDKDMHKTKQNRKYYRQNDFVCCTESLELAGPMKREECIEKGFKFREY
jgi:hypothetical protein